jgi:hypothetical protein
MKMLLYIFSIAPLNCYLGGSERCIKDIKINFDPAWEPSHDSD